MIIENHSHFEIKKTTSHTAILIKIELTFLLIMIEIPGLWHFKAHDVLFPNILKLVSKGAPRGPPRRGAPLLGVGRVALKPTLRYCDMINI